MYFEDVKISIQAGIRQGIQAELEKLGYKKDIERSNFFRQEYQHDASPDVKLFYNQDTVEEFVDRLLEPTYRDHPYLN